MIIGVDPGINGGLAVISNGGKGVYLFSFKNKTEYEIAGEFNKISQEPNTHAYLEKVHSAPGQGVASMFTFGQSYGMLRGFLVAFKIPFEDVTPQEWQRALRIPSRKGKTYYEHKKTLKQIACQLYPQATINSETADALLLAQYGLLKRASLNQLDI